MISVSHVLGNGVAILGPCTLSCTIAWELTVVWVWHPDSSGPTHGDIDAMTH